MANKTITANGSKGHHRFSLTVNEASTSGNSSFLDFTFQISPIQNGYDWYDWGSSIRYNITINENIYTGTIPAYNGTSTVTLKNISNIEVPHNSDGTKTINISFSVTDNTGVNYTCGNASASDTMELTVLHLSPIISINSVTEKNEDIDSLITNEIVSNLSIKEFSVDFTTYDNATPSNLYVFDVNHNSLPNVFTYELIDSEDGTRNYTGKITINFGNFQLQDTAIVNNKTHFDIRLVDSLNSFKAIITSEYDVIKYSKPNLERTSTNIKRKTGGGIVLTDNVVSLNLRGTIYKENDSIGNNNSISQIGYKIWNPSTETEPVNYTSITTAQITDGVVTVTDLEINNINYTSVYNYKIILADDYENYALIDDGVIPTGVSLWTEFENYVDFLNLTKQGKPIYSNIYSSNETIIGIDGNNLRYRKVIDFGALPNTAVKSVAHGISNLSMIKKIEIVGYDSNGSMWFPIPFVPSASMYSNASCSARIDNTNINIFTTSDWSNFTAEVTLEYTKS